ncbi:MAG: phosphate-starvation-inducible PsiE family protein [Gammaproteobacteria bacterium]|nr:phosphate-starvation-inducible PsiE family protein [Gammaproteobacteria bacterium]
MLPLLKKFERAVVVFLIAMLVIVVAVSALELAWILIKDLLSEPVLILELDELLEVFGFFLLVLIGIELLETISNYLEKGRIELKVIFSVALIAIGRKIIIFEPKDYDGLTLVGIGVIILALVIGYGIVTDRLTHRAQQS